MKATLWYKTEQGWEDFGEVKIKDRCVKKIADDWDDNVGCICKGSLKITDGGFECKNCGAFYELEVKKIKNENHTA